MKNKDYWQQRRLANNKRDIKEENELLVELFKILAEGYEDTINKLYAFYTKFAEENDMTITQAQKLLTPIELKECAERINRLVEIADKIDTSTPFGKARKKQIEREIRIMRGRGRITREQLLLDSINEKWIEVSYKMDKKLGDFLVKNYDREFKDSLKEANVEKMTIPIKQIEASILIPKYAYHFSDTIWKNKDKLLTFINTEIRRGLVQGTDVRKTAKKLKDSMKVTEYQAKRLVVTESAIARTEGSLEAYRQSEVVNELIVLVTMDKRTCPQCKNYDNYVVRVDEAIVGDNIPPYHPGCRCSVAPYIND